MGALHVPHSSHPLQPFHPLHSSSAFQMDAAALMVFVMVMVNVDKSLTSLSVSGTWDTGYSSDSADSTLSDWYAAVCMGLPSLHTLRTSGEAGGTSGTSDAPGTSGSRRRAT